MMLGLCVAMAGCATPPAEEGESRSHFLAGLPSMPALPTIHMPGIDVSALHIPGTNRQPPEVDPELEPVIYWRVIDDDILVIHADTHGCTVRADFTVDVEQYSGDIYTVRLLRDRPDRCGEDLPWGVQMGFGFEELGVPIGGQVVVLNPLDRRAWDWNDQAGRQTVAQR
tara:strand:+ start:758 stop:1264 length:507 start_codon:yes stop_codon:yes gene_type:complete